MTVHNSVVDAWDRIVSATNRRRNRHDETQRLATRGDEGKLGQRVSDVADRLRQLADEMEADLD